MNVHWNLHPGSYRGSCLGAWLGHTCTSSRPFAWARIRRRLQLWQAVAYPQCNYECPGRMGTALQLQSLGGTAVTQTVVGSGGRGLGGRRRQRAVRICGLYERSAAGDGAPCLRRRGARWGGRPRTRRCPAPPHRALGGAGLCGAGGEGQHRYTAPPLGPNAIWSAFGGNAARLAFHRKTD